MLTAPIATARDGAVHDALRDQLVALLPATARIRTHGWRPWASASFVGARHWFDIGASTPPYGEAWDANEWAVPGSFVADVAISPAEGGSSQWRIELLTVDD